MTDTQTTLLDHIYRRRGELLNMPKLSPHFADGYLKALSEVEDVVRELPPEKPIITGETSDGYHTFNELYHHRAVLFSIIIKMFPTRAWKSKKHHDGSMFYGMFIVGIETSAGQATYHYDLDPYWDMFDCQELDYAPEWDGHTAADAIERIGKLEAVQHGRWEFRQNKECSWCTDAICTACTNIIDSYVYNGLEYRQKAIKKRLRYCPNCGAKMDKEEPNE